MAPGINSTLSSSYFFFFINTLSWPGAYKSHLGTAGHWLSCPPGLPGQALMSELHFLWVPMCSYYPGSSLNHLIVYNLIQTQIWLGGIWRKVFGAFPYTARMICSVQNASLLRNGRIHIKDCVNCKVLSRCDLALPWDLLRTPGQWAAGRFHLHFQDGQVLHQRGCITCLKMCD